MVAAFEEEVGRYGPVGGEDGAEEELAEVDAFEP